MMVLNSYNSKEIRLAGIVRESITDGPGIRFTVFGQGCPHMCNGCHNPQTWSFEGGKMTSVERIFQEIKKNPLLKGVTFSGGEPFCQAEGFAALGELVKDAGLDIVVFTGYTYEELVKMEDEHVKHLLDLTDILIDGPFIQEKKDLSLKFRGSSNQRIIDIKKTKENAKIILAID